MPPAPTTTATTIIAGGGGGRGAVRRLLVAGLGNASHPLTRHSVSKLVSGVCSNLHADVG